MIGYLLRFNFIGTLILEERSVTGIKYTNKKPCREVAFPDRANSFNRFNKKNQTKCTKMN
jgi:hypothetical protein